jgi:tetratricopeptide (TPR) repeat protein
MCYEMVTGQHPFASDSPMLLAVTKLRRLPRPPRELVPNLDPRWQAAILRCLDVDPARRFQVAKDVVAAIEGRPRRRPWMIAAAAVAAIAVGWTATRIIEPGAAISTSVAPRAAAERIVAVLPFTQESPSPEGDALTLGLTAALTDRLHSMSRGQQGLHVIPSEEVINTGVSTPALAQHTLGASLFVAGRVSVVDDRTEIAIGLNELSDQGFRLRDSRKVVISSGKGSILEAVAVATMQLLDINPPPVDQRQSTDARTLEAEKPYLLGRGYLAQGPTRLSAAVEAFGRAIGQHEQFARAHAGLSEAHLALYEATRDPRHLRFALESADRAVGIEPRDARSRVTRGRLYLMSSQYQRAIQELTTALDLDADVPDGRRWLAAAHRGDGAIDKEETILGEAVARHPKHWSGHVQLGVFLYRQGRYNEAEKSLVKGSELAPDNQVVMLNLSAVYLAQERFAAAETELVKAAKASPDALTYNNLAWVYVLEGKFGEAAKTMEKAVKLSRATALVLSSLARTYRWADRRDDETRTAYQKALERADEELRVDPQNAGVKGNRAYLLVEMGRREEGVREIEEAVKLESAKGNVIVFFNSALVHERVGQRERAMQDLLVAARLGYSRGVIERHPDLTRLRKDPGYRRVIDVAGKPDG